MFSFKQYCISECHGGKYLFLPDSLYECLTSEELEMIHAEDSRQGYRRCWYPASNYWNRPMHPEERRRLMQKALTEGDFAMMVKLKQPKG